MKTSLFAGATLTALFSGHALANEPLTLVLDWYINPTMRRLWWPSRSAPLRRRAGRQDCPAVRPGAAAALVAARQADLAITYQPQVHFFADEGLPLVRVGTLINSPLNTVIALDKQIKTPADLQGKKVGYSVSGIEQATLATMAQHAGIDPPASSWLTSISS
jgi:putative hydroxymethylpyrimidine transport system substrate-binding protein